MAGYVVRPMRLADARGIAEVHVRAWHEAYRDIVPAEAMPGLDEIDDRERRWRELLADPDPSLIAVVGLSPDGRVVGIGVAGPARDDDPPTDWQLGMLNVLAEAYGTGLADLMMADLVGDRAASLWVFEANARARAFYTRHGFVPDGATQVEEAFGAAPEIRMVRR